MDKTALNRLDIRPLVLLGSMLLFAGAALFGAAARSQSLDPSDLDELVAPIALYPDDLLGIILPASTFPLDVVRAARFLDDLEQDPTLEPDAAWDESIVALLNYPEILRMMDEDLDWTWALGEAVLTDEEAVLAAAQDFRRRALLAGNLGSDDKQVVSDSGGVIQIKPADPEVVYVPAYDPQEVVVYQPYPVYRYYPVAYPLYYYPYPAGYFWDSGFFWGVTSYFSIGWNTHHLHLYHQSNRLHPYYLSSYYFYTPYYYRTNVPVTVVVNNDTNVWVPRPRRGDRPRTITAEGRDSLVRTGRTATTESQPNLSAARASGARLGTSASGQAATTTTTTRTRTTIGTTSRRAGTPSASANSSDRRQEPVINGRVERSDAASTSTAAPTRTRPVPSTTNSPSQLRGIRTPTATPAPSTAQPRTRVQTPAPSTSSTQSSSGSTTFRGVRPTIGSPTATRSATAPPATRSAPAASSTRSAPVTRSAPATRSAPPTQSAPVTRSAPAPQSAPAPRVSAPAPTRNSGARIGGISRSAQTQSSSSSQNTRRPR